MFTKHKWIEFQFETDAGGSNWLVEAKGWIGNPYEREYPDDTKVEIIKVTSLDEPVVELPLLSPSMIEYWESEALDYFKVNFESNS